MNRAPLSLRIFKKEKGLNISTENLVLIVLSLLLFLIVFLEQEYEFAIYGLKIFVIITWLLYFLGLIMSNLTRHEKINMEYVGHLTLFEDKVNINENSFELLLVSKITFDHTQDIKGKFNFYGSIFSPCLSNGIDNMVTLKLTDGTKKEYNFFQTSTYQLKHFKELLIAYHKKGKISWFNLLDILEITEYEEIQNFKQEINTSIKTTH